MFSHMNLFLLIAQYLKVNRKDLPVHDPMIRPRNERWELSMATGLIYWLEIEHNMMNWPAGRSLGIYGLQE